MRVLQVIQELAVGGAERVVATLSSGAPLEVAIAAAPGPLDAELDVERFELPLLERRPWRLGSGALALRRAVRTWRPTVVHCHNPGMAALASLATLRGHRPPALVTVHGVPEEDYAATARLLRLAGLPVVACGPGVAAGLEEHGLKVAATIVNGVAPAALETRAPAFPGRYALVVGRLVPQKNVRLALEAVARLDGVPLVIAGEGPLRPELEAHAARLGIAERVTFAGARSDARQLMTEAAAVLVTSHWEGLPLVVLEALAAGTPVVATAVRGVRELLTPETAALVQPDDPDALAQALDRILRNDGYASSLATAGRALAARYSEQAMVAEYLALYARLAAGGVG